MNERKGRIHRTHIKEQVNDEFLQLTPEALDALRDIMNDPDINPIARVQAIGLILDRGLGKPEETMRLMSARESVEAAQERIAAIVNSIPDESDE